MEDKIGTDVSTVTVEGGQNGEIKEVTTGFTCSSLGDTRTARGNFVWELFRNVTIWKTRLSMGR